ncbi:MAG: hypothetical protein ACLR2G_07255 [Phascolarctobacterium faecium]
MLDATTGQNAINQAKVFMETANVTGVVLTKPTVRLKAVSLLLSKKNLACLLVDRCRRRHYGFPAL